MKKAAAGQKKGKEILTFTVAECGEYHNMGEYYEGIATVEEAIEIYLQIPPERMHGIPSIGINLHVEGTDSLQDSQIDILSGNEIDVGMIGLTPEFYEKPQVWEAVKVIIERFPEKEVVDY